ncbi:glycine cleavage system aminomethyltransferase GcvT [Altererythrobacter lutimaris]|uniref:aminomethyltransferase n=1 Tax=Altererythrobacter lutimaris TaxID=2743979 RepID=A0A850HIY5_9SPHN|nr:glycine cleavage system aminomethyltransferase GcvT [Altererythrobacter lutimaris]NVE95872.1 glycine cleavage system aminomethyltransferase GcvT [Altererythrobacter lutimaris]
MSDETPETEELGTLPLDAWHRAQGARMVPFAGYEMPIQYEGIVAEHNWTRESASLFDVSHMGQLTLKGENAAHELEKLLPGAISNLKPGKMRYSLLLTEAGGIIDDLMVTNTGPHLALVVNGACKWDDIAHLREHLPDDITLTHFDDFALLALQGPRAGEVLEGLIPGTGALTFMTAGLFEYDGGHIWVSRAGYTGEDGFEIAVHESKVEALANVMVADERVKPAGLGARDSLRLEAGLPLYGHDLDQNIDPVSADLTFALSKKRREAGGYFGHMAVAARLADVEAGTLKTKRVGLKLDGRMPAREGAEVYAGDTKVGRVTSGGFSPTLGLPIAMAYVGTAYAAEGTQLECEVRGKRLAATVTAMPFVPHRYYRGS